MKLELQVMVPAQASLVLLLPDGTTRAPTREELYVLSLRDTDELYERLDRMLLRLTGRDADDTKGGSALRYFFEYVYLYNHDAPEEAFTELRRILGIKVAPAPPVAAEVAEP